MKNRKYIVTWLLALCIGLLAVTTKTRAATASYSYSIASGVYFPLSYPFQADTIANVFPNPGVDTELQFWDFVNDSWGTVTTYSTIFSAWSSPNFVMTNGVGFLYKHSDIGNRTITVSGTLPTGSSISKNFVGGHWHLIGTPYLYDDNDHRFLECVNPTGTANLYTLTSRAVSFNLNDLLSMWDLGNDVFIDGKRLNTDLTVSGLRIGAR
jgi:hypothetical protein